MEQNIETSWLLIKKAFPVLNETFHLPFEDHIKEDEFYAVVRLVNELKMTPLIQWMIVNKIEKHVRERVAVDFWSYFGKPENEYDGFRQFYKAIELLYDYFIQYSHVMVKLDLLRESNKLTGSIYNESNAINALKLIIRAVLLSQLPISHRNIIENFYEVALKMEDIEQNITLEESCKVCLRDTNKCVCPHYFYETNRKLAELGLLEPLVGQVLTSLIYVYIETHIQKICKDNFDVSYIDALEKWLDSVVLSWVKKVYCCDPQPVLNNTINQSNKKLTNFLYETYCKIRIDQLFNIIIEYPESLPALEDLRLCLPKTDLRPVLTKKLQKAMETRLLHPGVSTPDILTAYVAAIRSMRALDPTGLLMETITQPVHQYLRSREDTVRCVVSSLTEEGPNDLAEELVRGDAVQMDETTRSDEEAENWETWMPDPVDADPSNSLVSHRNSDIISMLVNVYGSKELFVNEYRTLLADRLLSQFSCDTEKEIRYLELLKLRFGDSQLHYCEVMLKDVQDSKRINQHIKNDPEYAEDGFPINAMIVSAQFWPAFKEEKLELHPRLVAQLDAYTRAFETLKGNRTLCWKNHLGVVDLEIELSDRTLNLSVSPVHATILMHFQMKNEWSLDELSKLMHIPPTFLRKKIGFWQSHGILIETQTDVFYLLEEQEDKDKNQSNDIIVEDFESESAMASTRDQREEELQTFWSYIIGMLMNLDTLPLERIHQMLKMFAFQGPTIECSLQELKIFLDRKVREHKLIFSGGSYRLPKP